MSWMKIATSVAEVKKRENIDFSLPADKSLGVLCKESNSNSSGLPKINGDTLTTNVNPMSQMRTDSFEVTASPCVNVPQQVKFGAREQCLLPHTIDVPVCQVSGIPTSLLCDTGASVTTISEKLFNKFHNCKKMPSSKTFQQTIRTVSGENMPIKGVPLVPFQIGEYNYTFYAYIIENLAYDAILGYDFRCRYQGIDFDNQSLELLPSSEKRPPTETQPPCPISS
ncbi:Hypothetical predicted protein [Paramuricea clavata]|uniref:Uncharacterized protein n=1 Tax=Paramuricea clavata TaxID=317549 RepID=A0A6S7J3R1_PARCT|nr:Hypothetical predicted protein [Paramuricea clavata]